MCPLIADDELCAFIVASPKRRDLNRDGRYALHSFPADANEDAFYVTGRASSVDDRATVAALASQYARERKLSKPPAELASWELFAFDIDTCLLTRTAGHGDPAPRHTIWHSTSET
jgi:hypothetical protein